MKTIPDFLIEGIRFLIFYGEFYGGNERVEGEFERVGGPLSARRDALSSRETLWARERFFERMEGTLSVRGIALSAWRHFGRARDALSTGALL